VRRRVRIAADDRHSRQGEALLGSDDVHDALPDVVLGVIFDAEIASVLGEQRLNPLRAGKAATAAGFRTVHAFPLRLRAQAIGALNIFGTAAEPVLTDEDIAIVQSLADMASIALLQERAIRRSEILTEQLQGALNSRVIIEQAKGAVAQAKGISVDAAFDAIRGYARAHSRRLSEVAYAVVSMPDSVRDLLRT